MARTIYGTNEPHSRLVEDCGDDYEEACNVLETCEAVAQGVESPGRYTFLGTYDIDARGCYVVVRPCFTEED